jgi:hypothetical protein
MTAKADHTRYHEDLPSYLLMAFLLVLMSLAMTGVYEWKREEDFRVDHRVRPRGRQVGLGLGVLSGHDSRQRGVVGNIEVYVCRAEEELSIAPKINKFGLDCGLKNKFEVMVEFSIQKHAILLLEHQACARKLSNAFAVCDPCLLFAAHWIDGPGGPSEYTNVALILH